MTQLNLLVLVVLPATLMTGGLRAHAQAPTQEGSVPAAPATTPTAPEAMDELLAPIALYPDALIIQIVTCASSPFQVKQVSAWLKEHPDLKGTAAQDAAGEQGFDASFIAIVLFPQVVHTMADKPDWTRDLGQAFATERDGVFASIQRLRQQAQSVGNLKTTEQQEVQNVATQDGQQVIVIQPANPQVVYVPTYNPQVVYTQPAPAPAPTDTTDENSGEVAVAALIGFAAGVIVGAAADDDDDYYHYAYGGWGYHGAALCNEGWEDFYDHRENMANDYYDHRENMAAQRGQNQADRQQTGSQNQADRQSTGSQQRSSRQSSRSESQATASQNQSVNQSSRQSTAQANRATTSSRGASQSGSSTARAGGTNSSAFTGYQKGSTERASSARGSASTSRSSGGRGGSRSGGRSGGGRR